MRVLLSLSVLVSIAFCQLVPNVVLTGEPRVVSRRILKVDMKTAQQMEVPEIPDHTRSHVNVLNGSEARQSGYLTEEPRPLTVYRRILRPARITAGGDWTATGDAVEVDSWTLVRRPGVDPSTNTITTTKV